MDNKVEMKRMAEKTIDISNNVLNWQAVDQVNENLKERYGPFCMKIMPFRL
jgi:hypothetical protein